MENVIFIVWRESVEALLSEYKGVLVVASCMPG